MGLLFDPEAEVLIRKMRAKEEKGMLLYVEQEKEQGKAQAEAMPLQIRGLTKHYPGFSLKQADLCVRPGEIMGLVGENGAGKSTLMKAMLDLIRKDGGEVRFWGKRLADEPAAIKNRIGVVLDEINFYQSIHAEDVSRICRRIYASWDQTQYERFLTDAGISMKKAIKDFSKGMKVKLSLAVALSHGADLLILDEPTSGLDPIAREEILEIFKDYVADGRRAILLSSHITGDLEKAADEITFIHQGQVVFTRDKAELLAEGEIGEIMMRYAKGEGR